MKKWHLNFIALLLAAALMGCSGSEFAPPDTPTPSVSDPVPTATVTQSPFALPCYPTASMHPLFADSSTNLALMPLIYEGLFEINAAWEAEPLLCEAAVCDESATRWTLTIRQGVTFSDGSRLTAPIVRDALLAAGRTPSLYAARLAGIASVTAPKEDTVVITLSEPNGALPLLLDVPICLDGDAPLGTGPYILADGALVARNQWWRGLNRPLGRIPLHSLASADDMLHAFDSGTVSLVSADFTATNALGYSGNYEVWEYPTNTMLYLGFRADGGVCQNPALRTAIAHGIDRETIADTLLAGHATPRALPGRNYDRYDDALAERLGYAPEVMESLLDAAGYPKGEDGIRRDGRKAMALTMIVNTDNSFKVKIAERIAGDLQAAGLAVELKTMAWEEYLTALERGNFDLYLGECRLTADLDLSDLILRGGTLNYGKYHSAEMALAHAELRAATGDARVIPTTVFYERFVEEIPFAPICFKTASMLTRWGRVSGAKPTQQNLFYALDGWRIAD